MRKGETIDLNKLLAQMFRYYRVKIKFATKFAAGIPKDPSKLLDFLEARAPERPPEDATPLDKLAKAVEAEIFEPVESQQAAITTTFKRDGSGPVYEARSILAHLKDCTAVLSKNFLNVKGLKAAVADRVWVQPEMIPLFMDGERADKPDGEEIKPISIFIKGEGRRTAVKIVEYLDKPNMTFYLKSLNDGVITIELLRALFEYGGNIRGMGQDRGLGWGRYQVLELAEIGEEEYLSMGFPKTGCVAV